VISEEELKELLEYKALVLTYINKTAFGGPIHNKAHADAMARLEIKIASLGGMSR